MQPILLDISRTVARARLPAPTGIDRVERAYIRWALTRGPNALFLASFDGYQHIVDADAVRDLISWLDGNSRDPRLDIKGYLRPQRDHRLRMAQSIIRRHALTRCRTHELTPGAMQGALIYLNVGHDNLSEPSIHELAAAGLRSCVMVHDTIPLDHPQFARDGSTDKFTRFLAAASAADVLLTNSNDTAARLVHHLPESRPVAAPLGIDLPSPATVPIAPTGSGAAPDPRTPSFLILGTIEPRKNHALLLDCWAGFAGATDAPHLRIAGRRGWKNADLFARLDTDPMMGQIVHEIGAISDSELAAEITSARAVLFPSHAEGYGLPLGEALAAGTPVIAADLPALREVGGNAPEWLAPGDPAAWRQTILAYAADPSPARIAQLERMRSWQMPTWDRHFQIVEAALTPHIT